MDKKELIKKYEKYVSSTNYLLNEQFTYNEVEQILKLKQDEDIKLLFNSIFIIDDEIIKGMKKVANDPKSRQALINTVYKLNRIDEFDGEELFKQINNDDFIEYMNIIDQNKISRNISIYSLLFKFSKDTTVPNWKDNPKLFNIYVDDSQKYYYNLKDINKYKEYREEYYIKMINEGHPRLLSNILCSYFGMNYNVFKENIQNIKYIDNKINFIKDKNLFDYIDNIDKLDKKGLLEYIKKIKNLENYFDNIKLQLKEISKKDLIKEINFMPISAQPIKNFEGEDFTFLVHKIKGLLQEGIALKLEHDISEWDKNYKENSYVSCSLISNDNLSLTSGKHLTLGFQNINKNQILAINNKDMLFKEKDIKANQFDLVSNYLLTEQILKMTSCYNEIVLKRYNENKKAINPDYILTFENIDDKSKMASQYFNKPIYNINIEAYAEKLVEKLKLLKEKNYDLYLDYIKRLDSSVHTNYEDLKKYYNIIAMGIYNDSSEEEELISKINIYKNRK